MTQEEQANRATALGYAVSVHTQIAFGEGDVLSLARDFFEFLSGTEEELEA